MKGPRWQEQEGHPGAIWVREAEYQCRILLGTESGWLLAPCHTVQRAASVWGLGEGWGGEPRHWLGPRLLAEVPSPNLATHPSAPA